MANVPKLPNFDEFSRWLAARLNRPVVNLRRYDPVHTAGREARDEVVQARRTVESQSSESAQRPVSVEVIELLAAADSDASLPPEITTRRGFRLTLAYDVDAAADARSICVLVNCPTELTGAVESKTAYLWNGGERFEIGQFDAEGKALGMLPNGVEITAADFALGKVKLDAPDHD